MATWPKWATVPAEQARTALVDEDDWGPWVEGGECCRGIPGVFGAKESGHAADSPFFFHCLSCIAVVHRGIKIPSPNHARDHGLCLKCGQPAELDRNAIRVPAAAAQQAEARGITVARLSTRKFCASCDPYSRPYCRGRLCPNKGQRHRAYAGCTRLTRHNFPHCAAACARQKAVDKSTDAARSRKGKPPLDAVEPSSDALSPLDDVEPSSDALSPRGTSKRKLPRQVEARVCSICTTSFMAVSKRHVFCSRSCKDAKYRAHRAEREGKAIQGSQRA